ncbi:unnamed protein product [Coregonus sp. 'balchen']|nr:unnamed protein product [Coregonus sp. 'balchen']
MRAPPPGEIAMAIEFGSRQRLRWSVYRLAAQGDGLIGSEEHSNLEALKDPCSEMTCSYGSTCIQSSDGLSAKCMCPLSCDGKPEQVMCGSDGQDYRNECELHKQACHTKKNVRLQRQGSCNPCKDRENNLNVACRVEPRTHQPLTFPLPESCPPVNEPLCASDGQTYESECHMTRTGMQKGIELKKIHPGRCKKQEECKEECKFNGVCQVERLGVRCSCQPIQCDGTYKPLCGKDGRTYINDCERRRAECHAKAHIPVKQQGPCGESGPLGGEKVRLSLSVFVRVMSAAVRDTPLAAAQPLTPLVDTDHLGGVRDSPPIGLLVIESPAPLVSFPLDSRIHCPDKVPWQVRVRAQWVSVVAELLQSSDLMVHPDQAHHANDAICYLHTPSPCLGKACEFGAVCVVKNDEPVCECAGACPQTPDLVCGSDGHSYGSQCEMRAMGCALQKEIHIQHRGPCGMFEPGEQTQFGDGVRACSVSTMDNSKSPQRPESAEQGNKSDRQAALSKARWRNDDGDLDKSPHLVSTLAQAVLALPVFTASKGAQLEKAFIGTRVLIKDDTHRDLYRPDEACANCSFGAICDGQSGRCVCPQECVESHQPVCGSDGSTYDSECELHVRACTEQLDLRVLAQGECKTCGSAMCAWGARCIQNKCECPQCQGQAFSPVCGSDGFTYDNTCELGVASCVLKKKIEAAKPGSCDEDDVSNSPLWPDVVTVTETIVIV